MSKLNWNRSSFTKPSRLSDEINSNRKNGIARRNKQKSISNRNKQKSISKWTRGATYTFCNHYVCDAWVPASNNHKITGRCPSCRR